MSAPTHTPGPWCVKDGERGLLAGAPDAFMPFGGCGCCGSPWVNGEGDAVMVANARLIAAAPDLLEALKEVAGCFDIKDGLSVRDEQAIKRAACAIAKAGAA